MQACIKTQHCDTIVLFCVNTRLHLQWTSALRWMIWAVLCLIKLTVSGVEYLEPRNVEGHRGTVEEPYTVDRRITLDTDAVERRQVAIPRARAHTKLQRVTDCRPFTLRCRETERKKEKERDGWCKLFGDAQRQSPGSHATQIFFRGQGWVSQQGNMGGMANTLSVLANTLSVLVAQQEKGQWSQSYANTCLLGIEILMPPNHQWQLFNHEKSRSNYIRYAPRCTSLACLINHPRPFSKVMRLFEVSIFVVLLDFVNKICSRLCQAHCTLYTSLIIRDFHVSIFVTTLDSENQFFDKSRIL